MATQKYNKLAGKHVLVIGGTSGKRLHAIIISDDLKSMDSFQDLLAPQDEDEITSNK